MDLIRRDQRRLCARMDDCRGILCGEACGVDLGIIEAGEKCPGFRR